MATSRDTVSLTTGQLAARLSRAKAEGRAEALGELTAAVEELLAAQRVSRLPKVEAEEWTLGDPIYWVGGEATTDSSGPLIGTAAAPTVDPSTTGYVALADVVPRTTLDDVATANATDAASAVTLANALKAKLNALLAALRNGAAT